MRQAVRFGVRPIAARTRRPHGVEVPDDQDPTATAEAAPEHPACPEPRQRIPLAGKIKRPPFLLQHIANAIDPRRVVGTAVNPD